MRRATSLFTLLLVLGCLVGVPALAGEKKKPVTVKQQLAFGVEMAQRGLWSEALFRFKQANRMEPGNPRVLNNLAVAHESLGLFDQALEYYRAALEAQPENRVVRRNYARFVEFYQSFKPPEEGDEDGEGEGSEGDEPTAPAPEEVETAPSAKTPSSAEGLL